jgi:hypothetical protein
MQIHQNDCQNSPLISQSHLTLLEVKQLAENVFFFLVIPVGFIFSCDTISISFHLNFLRERSGHFILKMRFSPLQAKYMMDNVPS